ncbi:hypothetical protein HDU80_000868 [Chytriomyces hyalinus]|nr:hypothetical protein HDU80_000868 [Chytriomyces hyalinus]
MDEANARSRNKPVAANAVETNPKLKKTKTCTIRGKCQLDTSTKVRWFLKGCQQGQDQSDCPKFKEVFKGMAKQASSDGDTAMDTTESNESPTPTGNASANAAKPVYNLSSIIHDLDVEWLPFLESNKAEPPSGCLPLGRRSETSPLCLVVVVMSPSLTRTRPFPLKVMFWDIFYTSKANGFKYMIGKHCGDLYYLHTSNASPKSNHALTSSGSVSTVPIPLDKEVDIDMERVRITEPDNQFNK